MALNVLGGNVPSIVNPIPWGLIPAKNIYASQYQIQDEAYDYAIGGVPFLSGESLRGSYFRRQYTRDFAPIRKDQFDNQTVPGEQSILGWWLRSQSNFSLGAGAQYLDTSVDSTLGQRFYYSEHMDALSSPGNLNLTQASKQILSSANTNLMLRGVNVAGTDYVLVADAGVLKRVDYSGTVVSFTMPAGIVGSIQALTDDGVNYYFMDSTTGIYKGAINTTGSAATLIWSYTNNTTAPNSLEWVKGRLIATLGNNVYELVGSGPTLPVPKFTHFNTNFRFTSIIATPTAIMMSGYPVVGSTALGAGEVYKFTLDTSGSLPTLTAGMTTALMPPGEFINLMFSYVGSFVVLGTSKGLRVAQIDSNGDLVYGPLIFQNPNGVTAITGYDRFIFASNMNNAAIPQQSFVNPAAAATTTMMIRVDLSQQTSTGGFPYCNDLDAHATGIVLDSCNFGQSTAAAGLTVMAVKGQGVYVTDTANKEAIGLFYTSRIRFNTLEDKHFKYLYLRSQGITDGSISCTALDPTGGMTTVFNNGTANSVGKAMPVLIGPEGDAKEWIQFLFTFDRGLSNTNYTPVMNGYQLRGLPGVDRQIILTVPLSCHDFELDKFGNPVGYDGSANYRLNLLESLIRSGNLVLFQDLNYGEAELVIVDDYHFEQQANEQPKAGVQGGTDSNARGGYIIVTCRVVQ